MNQQSKYTVNVEYGDDNIPIDITQTFKSLDEAIKFCKSFKDEDYYYAKIIHDGKIVWTQTQHREQGSGD